MDGKNMRNGTGTYSNPIDHKLSKLRERQECLENVFFITQNPGFQDKRDAIHLPKASPTHCNVFSLHDRGKTHYHDGL
jgi:hypothetical protein